MDWLSDLHRRFGTFKCPSCGGSWFGTSYPLEPEKKLRHCHDEFGQRCRWTGKDAECGLHEDADRDS